ncbi:MAG: ATP-dependent exonuclease SbcCD, C subunit-like protein [Aquificaceae bacterium]|nr:MAG: ATP-dependent exonuclease SbcCD, C subunit-like protein [Aquificaceae bacterium]
MTKQAQLDLSSQAPTGFRLHRMELYNWGTFHESVWQINPEGNNSLLTGDIGSGKSTVVDAMTTLLVPAQKITFNKAAGAESKERNLNSYVRGAYKSEKSELTQTSKAVTLRDETAYTVLLAWFYNADIQQGMTLAQVFWLKEGNQNPERFYLTSEKPLNIKQHFSNFADINTLKRRLRARATVQISTTFREYSTLFRRHFGIQSEQALDLFYQTVSMKSVGNLTEFVRLHMLEKTNVETQLDNLLRGFDNLNRLHEAVLKARKQIEQLTPLVAGLSKFETLQVSIEALRNARSALGSWFARFQTELLQTQIEKLEQQSQKLIHQLEKISKNIENLRHKESDLRLTIEDKGGRRLREIEREVQQLQREVERCKRQYADYDKACQPLELSNQLDETQFYQNKQQLDLLNKKVEAKETLLQQQRDKNAIQLSVQRQDHEKLQEEIESLKQRKSNIPLRNLSIRQGLLDTLNLQEAELPFIGELLQVDEQHVEWEGAIERVLHNYGLSLLVPERLYKRVSQYVEQTHLKGRLVYFRIDDKQTLKPVTLASDSLAEKVRIKPDSEFYDWLENSLAQRFNYHCAKDMEDFRRHPYAITQNGQIKAGRQRHEKDDRYNIHDRSRYILGWSNLEKLKVLESQAKSVEQQIQALAMQVASVELQQRILRTKANALHDLQKIKQFSEIDWQSPTLAIERLHEEKKDIEDSSDVLQKLQMLLQQAIDERKQQEQKEKQGFTEQGNLASKLQNAQDDLQSAQGLVSEINDAVMEKHQALLQQWREKELGDTVFNLRNLDKNQREMREAMNTAIGNNTAKLNTLTQRIVQQMQDYKRNYPTETSEVDARIDGGREYVQMLEVLQSEDLPRHEATFKKMLNEQTIQGVVMFQSQLEKERRQIEDKISAINQSLQQIEYSTGTYITLLANLALDVDVRDFRSELKVILSNTLESDDLYTEDRFLQVKSIMERFKGREGQVEQDRRWMRKVTDVRNWYNFSASERWRENDEEKEFYSDSAGKSGGQKEKLAYTILASALAYQFGLESADNSARSFRFVVIDEAFGKGSDESTRYALELFRKLNLQLLIVTPLQKIHVIEDYINAVHFVHNREGKFSMLRNLSIEEYREEKAKVSG